MGRKATPITPEVKAFQARLESAVRPLKGRKWKAALAEAAGMPVNTMNTLFHRGQKLPDGAALAMIADGLTKIVARHVTMDSLVGRRAPERAARQLTVAEAAEALGLDELGDFFHSEYPDIWLALSRLPNGSGLRDQLRGHIREWAKLVMGETERLGIDMSDKEEPA